MLLLLFPCAPTPSDSRPRLRLLPGQLHAQGRPCPCVGRGPRIGYGAHCCAFKATELAHTLNERDEGSLSNMLRQDMDAAGAVAALKRLREVRSAFECEQERLSECRIAIRSSRLLGYTDRGIAVWSEPQPLPEAIEEVRRGIEWFEIVTKAGFGTSAWPPGSMAE